MACTLTRFHAQLTNTTIRIYSHSSCVILPKRCGTVIPHRDYSRQYARMLAGIRVSEDFLSWVCAPAPAHPHTHGRTRKKNFFKHMAKLTAHRCNVLIACEESQAEMLAFLDRGFNVFSCDIQKARYRADRHICGDVSSLLRGRTKFQTQDGKLHHVKKWHLIIAHPPCTYLCKVSSVHMMINGELQMGRYERMMQAREFFYQCLNAQADFVAVENPLPMARAKLPKPDCFIHPSWFGVKYTKKTLFWLRNLPPLMPEIINPRAKEFVRASRGKYRSRTFPQVASAIAKQWGEYVLNNAG